MLPPPPISTLFPYTTLFRSRRSFHFLIGAALGNGVARLEIEVDVLAGVGPEAGENIDFYLQACNAIDRKSTRLNSSHVEISYAVFCLKKKKKNQNKHSKPFR